MPDGSTNLPAYQQANDPNSPPMKWFVTIHNLTDYPNPSDTEVAVGGGANKRYINFYTIQIDPVSGAMKQFRPGI
jgi:hypothetical protein